MDNLHINNTAPTRTCLPPPGFSSAPNQANSYGISIPRNTGDLIFNLLYINFENKNKYHIKKISNTKKI